MLFQNEPATQYALLRCFSFPAMLKVFPLAAELRPQAWRALLSTLDAPTIE